MEQWLTNPLILAALLILALVLLLIPLALRLAGLSGSQISELLQETMKFVLSLITTFRAENSDGKSKP